MTNSEDRKKHEAAEGPDLKDQIITRLLEVREHGYRLPGDLHTLLDQLEDR